MPSRASYSGAVISFEGADGSGKGTQSRLLVDYLNEQGIPAKLESFPRYHTPTGKKVAAYLNGDLGTDVDSHTGSLLYSDDRLAFREEMIDWLQQGGVWVLDRYVDSNKGHQGGKFATKEERLAFFKDSDTVEFIQNDMPIPDATILFTLPVELAQAHVDKKATRAYTDKKRDLHEADPNHLKNANEAFTLFAETYPERVHHLPTVEGGGLSMRSLEAIQGDVIATVEPFIRHLRPKN